MNGQDVLSQARAVFTAGDKKGPRAKLTSALDYLEFGASLLVTSRPFSVDDFGPKDEVADAWSRLWLARGQLGSSGRAPSDLESWGAVLGLKQVTDLVEASAATLAEARI